MTIQSDAAVTRSTISGDATEQQTMARRKIWETPYVITATLSEETELVPGIISH